MKTIVFGFPERDIHALAASLTRWLGVPLYEMRSPMIGAWYSSQDSAAALRALREGRPFPASTLQLTLEYSDPESGFSAPAVPGGDALILYVKGEEHDLQRIGQQLHDASLGATALGSNKTD